MLNDFVFVLGNYACDKNCPYCIAKMNKNNTFSLEEEINMLKSKIVGYQKENVKFRHFVLSGNGEPSLYSYDALNEIKDIVEKSQLFNDFRIQTSGNLFFQKEKLALFDKWTKEITIISENSQEDKKFYKYKNNYLDSSEFLTSKNIRVNIVVLNSNLNKLSSIMNYYDSLECVSKLAIKILDNSNNNSKESKWIDENAISYSKVSEIIEQIKTNNKFENFEGNRLIFKTQNDKTVSLHYDPNNKYDEINLDRKNSFSWHNREIKKGKYGELSKVEEELDEAKEAIEQENHLMFLIELSDVIGAVEGIIENYGLKLEDLIKFSNKVKESKKND